MVFIALIKKVTLRAITSNGKWGILKNTPSGWATRHDRQNAVAPNRTDSVLSCPI